MHVGDFPLFNVAIDRDGLVATMRSCAIDIGMVFHPDNELVRRITRETPGVYGLVWANPREGDTAKKVAAYLDEAGSRFKGVKLHPLLDGYHPNDPAVHPILEILEERGLPALIHCGHPIFTLPWSIEELVQAHENARIILGHMGHGNIIYINASIEIAVRHPHVYLETSGMPMYAKIEEAVRRAGAGKVLYGSDLPFGHPASELARVRHSGLGEYDLIKVLGENARSLFFGTTELDTVA